jgi:hypothetical protein
MLTTQKIVGGSFGGSVDTETVDRLVNSHFSVFIKLADVLYLSTGEGGSVAISGALTQA